MIVDAGPLLVGIDVGTTSIKAGVFAADGNCLAQGSVPTPTRFPRPGWAYHSAEALWQGVASAVRQAIGALDGTGHDAGAVAAVAVASMGEAGVLLDARGRPREDVIAWFDRRTQPQVAWLEREIGRERLAAVTGLPPQPIFGLCKLLWLKEHRPAAFAGATTWLNVADWIAYRLCGAQATDYSLASRTLAFDLHRRRWSADILAGAGIPASLLAPLVPSGTRLGRVLPAAAEATGLPPGAAVAAGGHDHACGALAAGVTAPGQVLDSLGTAEAIFMPLAQPSPDPILAVQGYSQGAHVVPGRSYVHGGLYTAGACVEWLRAVLGETAGYETLLAEAAAAPTGSLGTYFVPHLRLANPPRDDPRARGAFVGLTADTTRGVLARAVLEGLAYESRLSLEALLALQGIGPLRHLVAIGGGSRNALFMAIKASVLDRTISVVDAPEATALGAAVLGGLGGGGYADVADAVLALRLDRHQVDPDPAATALYEPRFRQVYSRLYPALRELHHTADALESARAT